jgi:peptidoglycan/xylan/chitin deacetylase (PgdA/CDA1 family)
MTRTCFARLVRWSGLAAALRHVNARRVTIVVYHDPTPETLRAHLAHLARRYTFVTLDEVAAAMAGPGPWRSLPARPLVVTIDDGHRGNLRLIPVFREFAVRPTIYLCSAIVGTGQPFWWMTAAARQLGVETLKRLPDDERRHRLATAAGAAGDTGASGDAGAGNRQALTWDEVRRLGDVADFGAHTRHHPILPRCDDLTAHDEIAICRAELTGILGRPPRHFAYPNGDYGPRECDEIRHAGYTTARTIDPGWNEPGTDPLRLKCFPISDDADVEWLDVQMTGLPGWSRWVRMGLQERLRAERISPKASQTLSIAPSISWPAHATSYHKPGATPRREDDTKPNPAG